VYATSPGGKAYVVPEYGTFFHIALMKSLEGRAAELAPVNPSEGPSEWRITMRSLVHCLQVLLDSLNNDMKVSPLQRASWSILGDDAVFVTIDDTPDAKLCVKVHPGALLPEVSITIRDQTLSTIHYEDPDPNRDPLKGVAFKLRAGIYQLQVSIGKEHVRSWQRLVSVMPPDTNVLITIEQ
jgi:hypothetical protein